jgi:hypothetical protein
MVKPVRVVAPLCTLLWTISGVSAHAEVQGPLRCQYVKPDALIKCAILADGVVVTDASVNEGKCRSPLQVFEANKLMMKRNFGVDMDAVASFVRTYDKGEEFSLNVDKGCAVYRFAVRSKDAVFEFRVSE